MTQVLILHSFLCVYMTGMIWVIQLNHYPAFKYIENSNFCQFQNRLTAIMGGLAGPTMILELVTALALVVWPPGIQSSLVFRLNLAGVFAIWAMTFLVSVPIHNHLLREKNLASIERLVRTNWLRTCLWSLRSIGLSSLLMSQMEG